jgi:hypothetical protein
VGQKAINLSETYPSALTQTEGAAEISPPFVKPTMKLGDPDGGRSQGAVVAESFEGPVAAVVGIGLA